MRGAARSGPEASIRALARRASTLRRAGRLDRALDRVREAAGLVPAGGSDGPAPWSPLAAELLALECGVLIDGGRLDGVLPRLDAALQRELAAGSPEAARVARTRLHLEAGRLHALQSRLAPARAHLLEVLDAPRLDMLATLEGEPGGCVRVRAQAMLGAALCMHAEHAEGLQRLEQALAESQALNLDAARLDRARILINLSAAHFEQRRLGEAQRRIEQAQALLQPLVRERRAGARADLGRAWINLGGIHADAGRLPDAVVAYRAALDTIDRAARSAALAGDRLRLRATRAKASMNLGHALFKCGDFDAAERHLAGALRRYAPLLQANPQLRADVARARVNAARLAARRGQADRAAALYARALADFESMMQGGAAPHLAGDAANARLGVARAALARGQARRSARLFAAAMATLCELTHAGQLHQAPAWLLAWVEQASVLVESAPSEATLAAMLPVLRGVLETPPLRALGELEEPLRMPATALDALQRWRSAAGVARDVVSALAAACLRHLFDITAQVLAESSPAWLAARQGAMHNWVQRLGEAAAAQDDAAPLLAQWLLCTRGLRAQRVALADGSGARLVALRASLAQLDRIEGELLGADCESARESEAADPLLALGAGAPTPNAARLAEWRALRDAVGCATASAVQDGLLPRALQLSATEIVQRLAPRQALLFVARLDRTRLVTVALHPSNTRHAIATLPDALAEAPCDLLNAAARQALRHDFGAEAWRDASPVAPRRIALAGLADGAAGDRLALAALREMAEHALGPSLRALSASGCTDISIVPADDLHLLPWVDLVRARSMDDATIAVYPSAAAWWRCRVQEASPPRDGAPLWAWACTAQAAGAPRLRWVDVEHRQSQRLWPTSSGENADALLAMGHGDLPDRNPARAGLRLADGRVLGAHEAGAAGYKRVLLSACVLGRTDEAFGEALGFLSTCFAYRARFGVGWLTEVPDEAACLFSLALQFALREALAGSDAVPGWSAVFHAACRTIERGEWPAGFADWLGREEACPAAPPASLRRLLPWVVALGD